MVVTVKIHRKGDGRKILKSIRNALVGPRHVKVGVIEGKTDQDNINKAFWNEFGTKGSQKGFMTPRGGGFGGPIPERPFMRTGAKKIQDGLKGKVPSLAKSILMGRTEMRTVLAKMGQYGVQEIRATIRAGGFEGNSETTKRLKGSSKPLIDTGALVGAISWEIDE